MASRKEQEERKIENVLSRSGRQVFMGDLERRRPTKRMTTVRSFVVVRNWENQNNEEQSNDQVSPSDHADVQSAQISSRTDIAHARSKSPELSHEPFGFKDVQPMSEDDNDIHMPSISDDVDVAPLTTLVKNNVEAEPSSDVSHKASLEFDDVIPMAVDESPKKDELSHDSQHVIERTLPGAAATVSETVLGTALRKSSSSKKRIMGDDPKNNDDEDDDMNVFQDETPLRNESPSQSVGLKSTGHQSKKPRVAARKRVVFDRRTKENNQPRFNEEEYEAQNFVRLFNADRGRKGGATDVTDLDIVLTNIEEVALDIKSKTDSALNKKMVREAFIQIRQIFSDTIDIYKEKKYLQSATSKTDSKMKKMRQELLSIQDKRRKTEAELNRLESNCSIAKKRIKGKEEAYNFLSEFESLQDKLRKSDTVRGQEEYCGNESLPSLLCEASGYLSTQRQLGNINDKLQLWLDKNNS